MKSLSLAVLLLGAVATLTAQSLPDAPSTPTAPAGFGKQARGISDTSASVTVSETEALSHVLTRPLQAYPPAASVNKVEGDVVVEATIDTNGDVSAAKAISGLQVFAPAAVAFVKQWIFRPFFDGATRVPAVARLTVRYSLFASQAERDMEQHFLQAYWPAWNAGEAALAKSDFETARKQYEIARDEAAKLGQANWQELANALARLGAVQYRQKNYPAAEPFLLQALQVQQAHREPDAPEIADALGNLGQLYMAENEYGKAEPILLKSVEIYDAHLQDPNASLQSLAGYKKHRVLNLFMLGSLNQEMGSGDDAVKYCDMAVGDAPRSMSSADAVLVIRTCETVYKKNMKFAKSREAENAAQALEQTAPPQK
jgi:TonB family protein